ncbi:MAG: hypothetical protein ACO1QR_14695 [Chthoniobacteraceae bacterium]
MKLNTNRINLVFTAEQTAEIDAAVTDLEAALVAMEAATPKERRDLVKLGPKSREFAELALTVARDHTALLPAGLDLPALERDAAVYAHLQAVRVRLEAVLTRVSDTCMFAGSDWMNGALTVYRALRAHGEGSGLDEVIRDLSRRFKKASVPPPEEPPTGA